MSEKRWVWPRPFALPTNATSGSFMVDIPKAAEFIGILNGSGAKLAYSKGKNYQQPPDAVIIQPYIYLGLPMEETQQLTVHWSSDAPLASDDNSGVLLFSNEPINVTGGPMTTGGVASAVTIQGTPNVNISSMPNVSVTSSPQVVLNQTSPLPPGTNAIGTVGLNAAIPAGSNSIGTVTLNAGTNNIGDVDVLTLPSLPAGTNNIGDVDVLTLPAIPAGGNQIGYVQENGSGALYDGTKSLSTTAAAISASQTCREVLVQADPMNTDHILIGNATSQNTHLTPGQSLVIPVNNISLIYGKSVSGTQTANFLGRS